MGWPKRPEGPKDGRGGLDGRPEGKSFNAETDE